MALNVYATTEAGHSGPEIVAVQVESPHAVTSVTALRGDITDDDGATISPDGKEIYVSVGEEKSDVWLMENFDPSPR